MIIFVVIEHNSIFDLPLWLPFHKNTNLFFWMNELEKNEKIMWAAGKFEISSLEMVRKSDIDTRVESFENDFMHV